jgi:tRNA 2-thiouridine synthesizing protein A
MTSPNPRSSHLDHEGDDAGRTPAEPEDARVDGRVDARVDGRGRRCPLPVIMLARAALDRPPGAVLELLADDPSARHDVPAWARLKGHTVALTDHGEHTAYRVVLGSQGEADPKSSAGA